jgi:translation initiation factor IF-1
MPSRLASPQLLTKALSVPSEPITTTGEVLHIYSDRAYQVSLPNGKEVIAHPSRSMISRKDEIVPGARVALEMTPFDFEKARISDIKAAPNSKS